METIYTNEPAQPPDLEGEEGQAWRVGPPSPLLPPAADLARWLVLQEGTWYGVSVIHLRSMEGGLPLSTRIDHPDATHEVAFFRLAGQLPDLVDGANGRSLPPCIFQHPFIARKDEDAVCLLELLVKHICQGVSPELDSDYWQGCLDQTAEHLLFGCHPSLN